MANTDITFAATTLHTHSGEALKGIVIADNGAALGYSEHNGLREYHVGCIITPADAAMVRYLDVECSYGTNLDNAALGFEQLATK